MSIPRAGAIEEAGEDGMVEKSDDVSIVVFIGIVATIGVEGLDS